VQTERVSVRVIVGIFHHSCQMYNTQLLIEIQALHFCSLHTATAAAACSTRSLPELQVRNLFVIFLSLFVFGGRDLWPRRTGHSCLLERSNQFWFLCAFCFRIKSPPHRTEGRTTDNLTTEFIKHTLAARKLNSWIYTVSEIWKHAKMSEKQKKTNS